MVHDSAFSSLEAFLKDQPSMPPIHQWNPELSGDMDLLIRSDGSWVHEGDVIQRKALVNLFASILRRESDGCYYLLTPVEKWRISVEEAPLLAVDMDIFDLGSEEQQLTFTTNVGTRFLLSEEFPLSVSVSEGEPLPVIHLANGLHAKLLRAVFYRLVESAKVVGEELKVLSDRRYYSLGNILGE